jgi:hypothetical protein
VTRETSKVKKLHTAAIGIGLALTLAGCGGGGGAPAAAILGPTTTTVKIVAKKDLLSAGDTNCKAAGLAFGELRRSAADMVANQAGDDAARDFLINTTIPQWEQMVGALRASGEPNRDARDYDKLNKTLGEALTRMKKETQNTPQVALADLADGPDKVVPVPAKAGDVFAEGNELADTFGFRDCSSF